MKFQTLKKGQTLHANIEDVQGYADKVIYSYVISILFTLGNI